MLNTIKAVVLGGAVADALGVPVEFSVREKLTLHPVTEMQGFGTYDVPAGSWSDDTSMSIAALDSLKTGKLDYNEIMQNFVKWLSQGEYTPEGKVFDVGHTCLTAVKNSCTGRSPLECGLPSDSANGNGSLMRVHPFVLYSVFAKGALDIDIIHNASRLTHAHKRSLIGCGIYAFVLAEIIANPTRDSVFEGLKKSCEYYTAEAELFPYIRLMAIDFPDIAEQDIKSTGYVVDTLEAALWCLLNTSNYKDCVLKAVNLGSDTDTVAAVAGTLAGALYGYESIPEEWLNTLIKRDYIEEMCGDAAKNWGLTE